MTKLYTDEGNYYEGADAIKGCMHVLKLFQEDPETVLTTTTDTFGLFVCLWD